jgi:hypothetical protein
MNETTNVMTPAHPDWNHFLNTLSGPEGCDGQGEGEEFNWKCGVDGDRFGYTRKALAGMGLTEEQIRGSIEYFTSDGAGCDCEVLLNIATRGEDASDESDNWARLHATDALDEDAK